MDAKPILIVDDDPCCRYALETLLISVGQNVVTASNGADAVDVAARVQPKLIFMDITMSGMDGYAATQLIHNQPGTTHTPVVAVSANNDSRHKTRAYEAGMIDFVSKPWQQSDIQRVLDQFVPEARIPHRASGKTLAF